MALEGIEVLLADLEAQAASQRERAGADARQRITEIETRAEAEIARIQEEADARLKRLAASDRERTMSGYRIEERRRLLEVRREALSRAFARAGERLTEGLDPAAYRKMLTRLIGGALGAIGTDADLQVARRDSSLCREIAKELGATGAVTERGDEPATVVAVTSDGRRRADNSLSARLAQARRLSEEDVAALLFGPPRGEGGL